MLKIGWRDDLNTRQASRSIRSSLHWKWYRKRQTAKQPLESLLVCHQFKHWPINLCYAYFIWQWIRYSGHLHNKARSITFIYTSISYTKCVSIKITKVSWNTALHMYWRYWFIFAMYHIVSWINEWVQMLLSTASKLNGTSKATLRMGIAHNKMEGDHFASCQYKRKAMFIFSSLSLPLSLLFTLWLSQKQYYCLEVNDDYFGRIRWIINPFNSLLWPNHIICSRHHKHNIIIFTAIKIPFNTILFSMIWPSCFFVVTFWTVSWSNPVE